MKLKLYNVLRWASLSWKFYAESNLSLYFIGIMVIVFYPLILLIKFMTASFQRPSSPKQFWPLIHLVLIEHN